MNRSIAIALMSFAFVVPPASAVVYCETEGVPPDCAVRPVDAGAPGVGVLPGVGAGAPGVGLVDPGINQPGSAGNVGVPGAGAPGPVGEPGNRGGPVNRPGRR